MGSDRPQVLEVIWKRGTIEPVYLPSPVQYSSLFDCLSINATDRLPLT